MPASNIATALAKAQLDMGPALKDSNNPAFKSKYADLASVMNACLPSMNKHGIAVVQPIGRDGDVRFVETVLIHGESGESLNCRVELMIGKHDMQGYGSAVTYARRYGLMAMAGIAPEDDDGNAAAKSPMTEDRPAPRGPTAAQVAADSLSNADSLDRLAAIWKDIPRSVQGEASVIKAKDDRKAALSKPADADLGGDAIPY